MVPLTQLEEEFFLFAKTLIFIFICWHLLDVEGNQNAKNVTAADTAHSGAETGPFSESERKSPAKAIVVDWQLRLRLHF